MNIAQFLRKRETRWYFLNVGAGMLALFAFAPFHIFPLIFVSLGILFWSWLPGRGLSPFLSGYSFGLGFFGLGVPWVYVSMSRFGGVDQITALVLTIAFVMFLSLYTALAGKLAAKIPARSDQQRLLVVFPAVWVLIEWIRGWLFTGFPWLNVGYSQTDFLLGGYGLLFGVYGIGIAVAVVSGLILCILLWRSERALVKRAFIAIAVILSIGTAALIIPWTAPTGRTLTATMVQGNVPQDIKWLPEQRQPTIETYFSMTLQNWKSDLIIWPETAMPFYLHQGDKVFRPLGDLARDQNTDILFGIAYLEEGEKLQSLAGSAIPVSSEPRVYNSMASLGHNEGLYHKRHLVPFGEYIPLKQAIGGVFDILSIPMSDFSAGAGEPTNMTLAGEKVAVSICYEDAFGEEVIAFLPEASLLINASNDAWFGESYSPHQHLQMARMRALETGRQMLRVTNTGVTALIDHDGRILERLPQFRTDFLTVEVSPRQGTTPYVLLGNWPAVIICLLALGFAVFNSRQREEKCEP